MRELDWRQVSAVVADVDETLIRDKSMFSFLPVYAELTRLIDPTQVQEELAALAATGQDRDEVNRAYYRRFAGHRPEALAVAGRLWFARRTGAPGFWNDLACEVLRQGVERAIPVVLLSGSHRACVEPVAHSVGASVVLCTELEIDDAGCLTGERAAPAIGKHKRQRLIDWATTAGVDLSQAIALGDDESDIAFLELTGWPIAVNPVSGLSAHAAARGWRILTDAGRQPVHPGRPQEPTEASHACLCGCVVAEYSQPVAAPDQAAALEDSLATLADPCRPRAAIAVHTH